MRRYLTAGVAGMTLAVSTLEAQVAPAAVGAPDRYQAAIAWARAFVRDTMRVLGAPGASITVLKDGRTVWSEGFGMADVEQQVSATPLTRFRIGSVSKPLTSAALGHGSPGRRAHLGNPALQAR